MMMMFYSVAVLTFLATSSSVGAALPDSKFAWSIVPPAGVDGSPYVNFNDQHTSNEVVTSSIIHSLDLSMPPIIAGPEECL